MASKRKLSPSASPGKKRPKLTEPRPVSALSLDEWKAVHPLSPPFACESWTEWAIVEGRLDIVKWIFSHPHLNVSSYAVKLKDRVIDTPLIEAVRANQTEIVRWLVMEGRVDVNLPARASNNTPLHVACVHGYTNIVKILCASPYSELLPNTKATISRACKNGHAVVVEFLLKKFPTQTLPPSLLSFACRNGHIAMVKLLVQQNNCAVIDAMANVLYGNWNHTSGDHLAVTQFFLDDCARDGVFDERTLVTAVAYGNFQAVRLMVECKHERVQVSLARAQQAVVAACKGGRLEILKYLVATVATTSVNLVKASLGPDATPKEEIAQTPLLAALSRGNRDVAAWLLEDETVDVSLAWDSEPTPLLTECARHGFLDLAAVLIDRGSPCDATSEQEQTATALTHAASLGNVEMVDLLMTKGRATVSAAAAIAACGTRNATQVLQRLLASPGATRLAPVAAELAVRVCVQGNLPAVQLLEATLPVNLATAYFYGAGVLHRACEHGNLPLVKYLVQTAQVPVNPSPSTANPSPLPLELACRMGHVGVIKWLVAHTDAHVSRVYHQSLRGSATGGRVLISLLRETRLLRERTALDEATRASGLSVPVVDLIAAFLTPERQADIDFFVVAASDDSSDSDQSEAHSSDDAFVASEDDVEEYVLTSEDDEGDESDESDASDESDEDM